MSHEIGVAYLVEQLRRNAATAAVHADPSVRQRATGRVRAWRRAIEGIFSGVIQVGSRTPVGGAPAWVTLRVLHGGFASGEYLAGGELAPWETALAERCEVPATRTSLHTWMLTPAGLDWLRARLVATD
jgi:hypothetical protein